MTAGADEAPRSGLRYRGALCVVRDLRSILASNGHFIGLQGFLEQCLEQLRTQCVVQRRVQWLTQSVMQFAIQLTTQLATESGTQLTIPLPVLSDEQWQVP